MHFALPVARGVGGKRSLSLGDTVNVPWLRGSDQQIRNDKIRREERP
jgi:hypothetical protein